MPSLKTLPPIRFDLVVWKQAKVHPDAHVVLERRLYSGPFQHIGKQVRLRAMGSSLAIFVGNERVATHSATGKGARTTIDSHASSPSHSLQPVPQKRRRVSVSHGAS